MGSAHYLNHRNIWLKFNENPLKDSGYGADTKSKDKSFDLDL